MSPQPPGGYPPPPPTAPPPPGWAPQRILVSAPPRELPGQDHTAVDDAERRARLVTRTIGVIAAAVLAVLLIVLAGARIG